jgi:LmbE family N-acetylglucosaminyl deacetylase
MSWTLPGAVMITPSKENGNQGSQPAGDHALEYNGLVSWIFLSPHFDDVALSCGGLVWELVQRGSQVSIWTICAGEVPVSGLSAFAETLHARWQTGQNAPAQRKLEDLRSCQRLGATQLCYSIPDCIYRRDPLSHAFMYTSEDSLYGELHPGDSRFIQAVQAEIRAGLSEADILVCPLGIGNHVDHQLTRLAAEGSGRSLGYYADFPYILKHRDQLDQLYANGWESRVFGISPEGLSAWIDSIAQHTSQISTFWPSLDEMACAIGTYLQQEAGCRLWRMPNQNADIFKA